MVFSDNEQNQISRGSNVAGFKSTDRTLNPDFPDLYLVSVIISLFVAFV